MKLVLISDTHCHHDSLVVPAGDVLICAGDFCSYGNSKEARRFLRWFEDQPQQHKLLTPGNHDLCIEQPEKAIQLLKLAPSVNYLFDSGVTIDGINFWGSPFTPMFCNWAFMQSEEKLKEKWSLIPDNCDVLITHGPPHSILDRNPRGDLCGSSTLLDRVIEVKPQLHIFGHIHCAYGCNYQSIEGTTFINCSICTEEYLPYNPIVEWEIEGPKEVI